MRAVMLTLFALALWGAGADGPKTTPVVIEGEIYQSDEVSFRTIDSLKVVAETPGGTYLLWELPDPEAPDTVVVPQKYATKHAISHELHAAIRSSYRGGRSAEIAAINEVVSRHPELKKVEPDMYEGRMLDDYVIWWRDSVDGKWVDDPYPETMLGTQHARSDLPPSSDQEVRGATRASAFRQLEWHRSGLIEALQNGRLLIIFCDGGRVVFSGVHRPLIRSFAPGKAEAVLEEIERVRADPKAELRFLTPEIAARFRR